MLTTPMTSPATPDRTEPIALPHVLAGRYELHRLLGSGGMGDVYSGVDVLLHREVAIKLLRRGPGSEAAEVARFHAEACALAAVSSPFIVAIHDFGFAPEGLYTVMRHVVGRPLDAILAERGALSARRALRITEQVLAGLSELHARGLVHGDVKPGNVIVDRGERAVLIDLGVAADLRAGRALGGGTPPYMAPEVGRHRVDHRVDLFATGILLVEVLSGAMVVDLGDCARRADAMPPALAAVVRVATDPEPEARYRHARAMRDAVRVAASQLRAAGVDERIRVGQTVRCADSSPVTVPSRGSKPRA
jgi:eukaryotic-like serine/threonine-protein kinase